mgnify:CR=1 FL=1
MIIKPQCPHCGQIITIDIKKIDRLEAEVAELRRLIDRQKPKEDDLPYVMQDLFGMFK